MPANSTLLARIREHWPECPDCTLGRDRTHHFDCEWDAPIGGVYVRPSRSGKAFTVYVGYWEWADNCVRLERQPLYPRTVASLALKLKELLHAR